MPNSSYPHFPVFFSVLLLWGCQSESHRQVQAVRDSIYKEDSLLAQYVMDRLKPRIVESMRGDSMKIKDTIRQKLELPLLIPENRNQPPAQKVAADSCTD